MHHPPTTTTNIDGSLFCHLSSSTTKKIIKISDRIRTTSFKMATSSFPQPDIVPGHRSISPPTLGSGTGGGFMLLSARSGRRWHVIQIDQACHYGDIFKAVEVVWAPSAEAWEERGYFAIKEIDVNLFMENVHANENPFKEISALQHLMAYGPHPNVIELTEVLRYENHIYMIFPYCDGGELFKVVATTSSRRLSEARAKTIFHDVLVGMSFVHGLGVCHRDMSLENILLDSNGQAKIINFGMARAGHPHGVPPTGPCGKKCYMAPEVAMSALSNRAYNGFKVDVWACGIVLFIMLAGIPPFDSPIPEEDERCRMVAVNGLLRNLVAGWNLPVCEEAVDLVQSCLQFDPTRRPTIDQLLSHRWFAS